MLQCVGECSPGGSAGRPVSVVKRGAMSSSGNPRLNGPSNVFRSWTGRKPMKRTQRFNDYVGFASPAKLMLRSLLVARVKMAAAGLSLILMTAGLGSVLRDALAAPQEPNPAPVAVARPPSTPVDRFGDPLPRYARARMETVRFNEGAFIVKQALYTPDGRSLVTVSENHAVHVWDVATGRVVRTIGNPESRFREIAISADGQAMATIEEVPGRLRLWDLASGRERRRWHGTKEANYHRLTFSPDNKTVAAATTWYNDVFIHLWDTTAPTERRRRIEGSRATSGT